MGLWPGEANQKSVAGAGQAACGSPDGPVCSAARPPDMPALARMATPPSDVTAGTRPLVLCAVGLPVFAGASETATRVSFPVCESLPSTGPRTALPAAGRKQVASVS